MKATQTCPKCAGKRFAVTPELRQPDHAAGNMSTAIPAITVSLFKHKPDISSRGGFLCTGRFETWICMGCGYTELYAYDLDELELMKMATQQPDRMRIVDASPPEKGPYR